MEFQTLTKVLLGRIKFLHGGGVDLALQHWQCLRMKHKAGAPRKPSLHQPIKELAEAQAMPAWRRRKRVNIHRKARCETVADYVAAIKAAARKP